MGGHDGRVAAVDGVVVRLGEMLERISDSWWPIPSAGAVVSLLLAGALITLDSALDSPPVIAFQGGAGEARMLMSTITSAMLSFIALVFSVSIVVFTLASGQFSPRVLRTFLRDRWSQATLGVFVGTFLLALIAFWAVRGSAADGTAFVPGLTITVVFLLVGGCVGMFVHFVHHITQEIRAVTVISRIHAETVATIDRRYPDPYRPAPPAAWQAPRDDDPDTFAADTTGVLANVRLARMVRLGRDHDVVLELMPRIGEFVIEGQATVRCFGNASVPAGKVRAALVFDPERSYRTDVAFGIRKLIDIAELALSPGVNDPTTARQCMDRIHAIMHRLAGRRLDVGVHRDQDGKVRLVEPVPTWDDYVGLAYDELRHWGADSIRVYERLHAHLTQLLTATAPPRHPPLRDQLDALEARARTDLPEIEREHVTGTDLPSRGR